MKEHDTLKTEKEAAEFLRVTIKAMQAWRVRGGGPTFLKVGRLVRYTEADMLNWLDGRRRESTSDKGRDAR